MSREKLEKEELHFLNAFEKVVNGDKISIEDKRTIKDYTYKWHEREIRQQMPCDCERLLTELKSVTE